MPRGGKKKVYPKGFVRQIERLYGSGMTQTEVAIELGTTLKVVRRAMSRYEISRRSRNERTQEQMDRFAASNRAAWARKADRTHPSDCAHCIAVRKPRYPNGRPQETIDKFRATVRAKKEPNYDNIHSRITADYGKASEYICECGKPAKDWALQHPVPSQYLRVSAEDSFRKGLSYSIREEDYEAKCRSCHRRDDKEYRLSKGGS